MEQRWRHETYKDDRDAEKQYLDELPAGRRRRRPVRSRWRRRRSHPKSSSGSTTRATAHAFWADHKHVLPLHYAVYLVAEVGCKRSAAANVETVFSGAGKFMEEASSAGHVLLRRMIKLHYNLKYIFIRPTVEEVWCVRATSPSMAREVHAPPSPRSRARTRRSPRPRPRRVRESSELITEASQRERVCAQRGSKTGLKTIINLSGELRRVLACARCPSALYTHCTLAVAAGACTCTGSEGVPCTGLYLVSKYTCTVSEVAILVLGVGLGVHHLNASVNTV